MLRSNQVTLDTQAGLSYLIVTPAPRVASIRSSQLGAAQRGAKKLCRGSAALFSTWERDPGEQIKAIHAISGTAEIRAMSSDVPLILTARTSLLGFSSATTGPVVIASPDDPQTTSMGI